MTTPRKPSPPAGLGVRGKKLWSAVVDEWVLDEWELVLLTDACRTADHVADLDKVVRKEGAVVEGRFGDRAHPALVESRQQKIALARILAALRLPDGEEGQESQNRRQRRVGARGVYRLQSVQ